MKLHPFVIAAAMFAAGTAAAEQIELSDADLCARLSASEVGATMGSERTAGPAALGGCAYQRDDSPALRLFNSSNATREEHLEWMQALKAKCSDGTNGAVLCSVGFDIENEEISGIWFTAGDAVLEVEADGGMTAAQAEALAAAAR